MLTALHISIDRYILFGVLSTENVALNFNYILLPAKIASTWRLQNHIVGLLSVVCMMYICHQNPR